MRPFKKPQAWDPSLAEQTLANHGKHTEEARRAREREMLASLGLADEEGISLEDDGGDVDEDAPDVEPDESARRELEARRRQAVDAQGYDRYMADLKQRARQAVRKLRSSEECDVDTIAQLELEIGVLDQENGVLKRRVNSSKAGSNLGDQATIVLGQYEEDIQHLQVRAGSGAGQAAGHAGTTSNGGPSASQAKLQQQVAALEQANDRLQQQLNAAQRAGPQQSSSRAAESNGEAAGQVAVLQEQVKAKQGRLDQFRQQRVEAMQAGTTEAKGKQKGAPQVESSRITAKVEEMLPIIDELHQFRDGIMADLMSMHSEVFNEKFHKQLLRTVRDQELDMRRKLQSEVRGEVQAAERRADEAHAEIESIRDSCQQTIKINKIETNAMIQHIQEKWKAEFEKRKRLHNLVLELKGSIRVLCRIRPFVEKEQQNLEKDRRGNAIVPVQPLSEEALRIVTDKGDKDFEFDRTFAHTEGQTQVFDEVCGLITTVLDGYNVCIMAYGQTGSGKTYTMEGPDADPGVNSRALTELFRLAQERSEDWDYQFRASVLEIYNERIYDLLAGGRDQDGDKLDVKQVMCVGEGS
ncbi:P-loop containing nucleoside triphosphate hydrolase protein [Dunaliella salina]|uniref:P-loop containing nucleoside triphosphate hydrolase protein n=1 Tax=Dunaliella salina TaxID=3046 RepID=A0ABQ7H5M7_DUNSA|nr:P-loop containing nucleoside triphosphate hydrolase protein [Dunaliella salina]|eukprot:KAF5842157.1 P-loop containing nucleoside triphosphate hydrolase protein [Dunaliella salina]